MIHEFESLFLDSLENEAIKIKVFSKSQVQFFPVPVGYLVSSKQKQKNQG